MFSANHCYEMHVNTPSLPQAQIFLIVPLTSTQAHTQPRTQVPTRTAAIAEVVLGASQAMFLLRRRENAEKM